MFLLSATLAVGAFSLTGCNSGAPGVAATPSPLPPPPDVAGKDVKFGSGFYPLEQFGGQTFRWVNDNAQLILCGDEPQKLSIDLEPGPSVGMTPMQLAISDNAGHSRAYRVPGRQVVAVDVPRIPGVVTLTMRVQSRHAIVPQEKRVLNLRVFKITAKRSSSCKLDIADSPEIKLGNKWFLLESSPNDSFRWVANDAEVLIKKGVRPRTLVIDAEPGPGEAGQPLKLSIRGANGATIATSKAIKGREVVSLPIAPGTTMVALHTANGGENIPGDTRTLNFRVFSIRIDPETRTPPAIDVVHASPSPAAKSSAAAKSSLAPSSSPAAKSSPGAKSSPTATPSPAARR